MQSCSRLLLVSTSCREKFAFVRDRRFASEKTTINHLIVIVVVVDNRMDKDGKWRNIEDQ